MKNNLPMRILGWIVFFVFGAVLGWIFFQGRETVMTATMLLSRNAYLPRFMDKAYLIVAGIIWLFAWMWLEGYFSHAVEKNRLWPCIMQMAGAELVLLFLLTFLPIFSTGGAVNWSRFVLITLALIAGVALLWISRRMLSQKRPASS